MAPNAEIPPDGATAAPLTSVLHDVAEKIARHRGAGIGEQNTKVTLINPVLRALGWDAEDLEDVRHEYRRQPHDKPVDYALMLARTPKLFIEAKGLDENLHDPRWANQIISYATVAGVEWVVLTNGDEYRIYNAHAPVPVEQKLFRAVKISENTEAAAEALRLLAKDKAQENSLGTLWSTYSINRRVKDAVDQLFAEPSPWLVRRLAKDLPGITVGDVRGALMRARIRLDFPEEELPAIESIPVRPSEGGEVATGLRDMARRTPSQYILPDVAAVTIKHLIESKVLEPPLDLVRKYKGQRIAGRIEPDGRVSTLGQTYDSVSLAASMARKAVIGAPAGRKYPQTNGWTFWRFRDHDGQERDINVLRERYLTHFGKPPTARKQPVRSETPGTTRTG